MPERNACQSIAERDFYDLAINYCWDLKLSDKVMEDLARIMTLQTMKSFYNKSSDTTVMGPTFRYLMDPKCTIEHLEEWIDKGHSYGQVRISIEGYLRMVKTDYIRGRLMHVLDAVRRSEYKKKIEDDVDKTPPPLPKKCPIKVKPRV